MACVNVWAPYLVTAPLADISARKYVLYPFSSRSVPVLFIFMFDLPTDLISDQVRDLKTPKSPA